MQKRAEERYSPGEIWRFDAGELAGEREIKIGGKGSNKKKVIT